MPTGSCVIPTMRWFIGGKAVERGGLFDQPDGAVRDRAAGEQRAPRGPSVPVRACGSTGCASLAASSRRVVLRHAAAAVSPTIGNLNLTAYNGHLGSKCYRAVFGAEPVRRPGALQEAPRAKCIAPTDGAMSWYRWSNVTCRTSHPPLLPRRLMHALDLKSYDYLDADWHARTPSGRQINKVLPDEHGSAPDSAPSAGAPTVGTLSDLCRLQFSGRKPGPKPRRVRRQVSSGIRVSCTRGSGSLSPGLGRPAERLVAFYDQRGTVEQWIKEGNSCLSGRHVYPADEDATRAMPFACSCTRYAYEARQLHAHPRAAR